MTDIERANKYWEQKELQVLRVAQKNGLDSALECAMELQEGFSLDTFLFDIFDNGDYEASEEEIVEAIIEVVA